MLWAHFVASAFLYPLSKIQCNVHFNYVDSKLLTFAYVHISEFLVLWISWRKQSAPLSSCKGVTEKVSTTSKWTSKTWKFISIFANSSTDKKQQKQQQPHIDAFHTFAWITTLLLLTKCFRQNSFAKTKMSKTIFPRNASQKNIKQIFLFDGQIYFVFTSFCSTFYLHSSFAAWINSYPVMQRCD